MANCATFLRVKDVPDKVNQTLDLLRLTKQDEGVFLRLNKTTMALLELVEPYITWGHPNIRIVRDLIFKRGHGRLEGRRRGPLSDNTHIEKALGQLHTLVHSLFS